MFRKKLKTLLASAAVATVFVVASATGASAMTQSDYTAVCKTNYGNAYYAIYPYPNDGAYGWRCRTFSLATFSGLNIEQYCQVAEGLHARLTNPADKWGWYCGY